MYRQLLEKDQQKGIMYPLTVSLIIGKHVESFFFQISHLHPK